MVDEALTFDPKVVVERGFEIDGEILWVEDVFEFRFFMNATTDVNRRRPSSCFKRSRWLSQLKFSFHGYAYTRKLCVTFFVL